MAGSCVFKPTVANKEGKEVDSKLWNSLLHFSSNDREFAKKYYFVGTNEEFLKANAKDVEYDENGEITFRSLKKLVPMNLESEKIIEQLNKDVRAGIQEYDKAISSVVDFNKNSQYNDEYMATISPVENNEVELKVVKKNEANQQALEETITNKTLFDKIKSAVERVGGSVSFIDENYSKYDTTNAKRAESGLYNLIFLSKKGNITADMAEEAGHFAVGALGDNPLVRRLESLCTPEVQKDILKERYSDVEHRGSSRREAAGYLVGKYILKEIDNQSTLGRLAGRIVNIAKKMFYRLTLNEVGRMRVDAQNIAKNIARNFMLGKDAGNIENALNTKETFKSLYPSVDSMQISTFKTILDKLDLLADEMKTIDKKLDGEWRKIVTESATGRLFQSPSLFADISAADGIIYAITELADKAPTMIELLNSVNYDDNDVSANAKKLRQVHVYVQRSLEIMSLIQSMLSSPNLTLTEPIIKSLNESYRALSSLIQGDNRLSVNLLAKERRLFLNFLKNVYGADYVERSARVVFNFSKGGLEQVKESRENTEDFLARALNSLERDDNFMDRYLASMADSSDIVNQLAYKAKMAANKQADDNTIEDWDTIRALERHIKDRGVDTNRLLEVSHKTGQITGNYISEANWGDWEDALDEYKEACKEEFYKIPGMSSRPIVEQEYEWGRFFKDKWKEWHKKNSVYDKNLGKYVPNIDPTNGKECYRNYDYDNLHRDEKIILTEILKIKASLDDKLLYHRSNGEIVEVAHTHLFRMPQFRGSNQNRIENAKRTSSLGGAVLSTLRQNVINAFTVTSEDRDYGSVATHNTVNDGLFPESYNDEKEQIRRVPLYGINRFKNKAELSTDICSGLLQYAAMANTYKATSEVVDILEIGNSVLENRHVKGKGIEKTNKKRSYVYSRYSDFLDAQVYNKFANHKLSLGRIALQKIISLLTTLGSRMFLGGNVQGGIVNTLTGFNEIVKEAVAGETYDLKELTKAHMIYFKNLPMNMLEAGKAVKDNKVSLFMKRFNVQNDLENKVREYKTREGRLHRLNPFGNNLLLPYKSGDHYMQSMSYLAAAQHYKFVDRNDPDGKQVSLYDALVEEYIDPNNPKIGKKLVLNKNLLFVDPKTGEHREWTQDDEVRYMNLCRETNNRMHGIYNKMDKTAFHNSWYGQAVLSMRGYALGLLYRRFSTGRHSLSLGRDSEGSMITFAKMVLNSFGSKRNFMYSMGAIICPFSKGTERRMREMGFSVEQYRNMRRNWADFALIGILWLLKSLSGKPSNDDDDPDYYYDDDGSHSKLGYLYYFTTRLLMEQQAYTTPWGLWQEQKTVLDWMPSGISAGGQLIDICKLIVTQEEYDKKTGTHEEGDLKWVAKVESYTPYIRSLKVLEDPYESAKSYEYGKFHYK